MTDATLPDPLVPAEVDLRGLSYMPLMGTHLFNSDFHARATDAEWRAGVTLWWAAWNQVPAGSLPTDDIVLCRLAELGRDLKTWNQVKERALHGFTECADGRLYHGLLAEQALIAWEKRVKERERKRKYRENRGNVTEGAWFALRKACFSRDEYRCVQCGSTEQLEADHIVPASKGGSNTIENLQTLCKPCNSSKNAQEQSATQNADATRTGRGQDADRTPLSALTGRDGTRRDETGRDGTEVLQPLPDAQARPARREKKASQDGQEAPGAAAATWEAYRAAYAAKYGTEPVRNALTNANILAFVKRVGQDEAPHIAAWFLNHRAAKYVANTHHTKLLMQDAESLRTQWATNRQTTSTSARQADKIGATGDALTTYLGTLEHSHESNRST